MNDNLSFCEQEACKALSEQTLSQLKLTFDMLNGEEYYEISYFILPNGAYMYPIKKTFFLEAIINELGFRGDL